MSFRVAIFDRYILGQILGTMGSVLAIVMSLMMLENLPRLLEMTSHSGRRGYIVAHIVASLLPEYGGIGLPVGLFLGIALTIRKLALRGELDAIEACGISSVRWMRYPLALAAMVSVLTLLNQGWLVPAGETKIAEIARRMENGEFGHRLQAGQFIDLGSDSMLLFEKIDPNNGQLVGLFLRAEDNVFTARQGHFWQLPSGAMAIELRDGRVVQEHGARVVDFARFAYRIGEREDARRGTSAQPLKRIEIGRLWEIGTASSRSAVYGRCLWAALILILPSLALVLGRPPRRQSGAVGILAGVVSLVAGLKMLAPLMDGHSTQPELLAAGILMIWGLFVSGLTRAETVFGRGFVDLWASRVVQNVRRSRN